MISPQPFALRLLISTIPEIISDVGVVIDYVLNNLSEELRKFLSLKTKEIVF